MPKIDERYLVVISGPSGCGKDTVVKRLLEIRPDTECSVSCTTRPRREHEVEGVDYYYISKSEFKTRIREHRMLEYAEYSGNLYGTPIDETEYRIKHKKTVILVIEVNGGMTVKKLYPHSLLVFITPPSFNELEKRLRCRCTETDCEIHKRLEIADSEMKQIEHYDAVVINDTVERCAQEIADIIDGWQNAAREETDA